MGALDEAIKQLNKRFGGEYITKGLGTVEYTRHPIGIDSLDLAIGNGLPERKIIMIAGKFSSGKSTTAICAVANCQADGGKAAWIDTEASFDPVWASKFGVKTEDLYICKPSTVEETTDIAETLLMSGELDLLVWDSVAVTPSAKELEESADQKSMAGIAKSVGLFMRKMTARLNSPKQNLRTTIILINQLRDNVSGYGQTLYTPGGKQLHYQSDIIIWLSPKSEPVGGKENAQGITVDFKVVKNRTAPPLRIGSYDLMFKGWVNNKKSIAEYGIKYGFIKKAGAMYSYDGKKYRGIDNLVESLEAEQIRKLKHDISDEMAKGNYDVKPEDDLDGKIE